MGPCLNQYVSVNSVRGKLNIATIVVGVMTGNPYLIASGSVSYFNTATSSYQGGGWDTAHQVMGYTAMALAAAGAFYTPSTKLG